ncbi:glycosyltransferase [Myxococcota bacterium]|nr:glycosyltransferase [Myxococcota bacterium]
MAMQTGIPASPRAQARTHAKTTERAKTAPLMPQRGPANSPQISIVTPCLNDAVWLGEAMASIHNQAFNDFEHIVIDGGSTDGSVELIRSHEEKLAYWCSEPDGGHADAIVKGVERARGEVVTWICSNDMLLPGSLRVVSEFFTRHPDCAWAVGDGLLIDDASRVLKRIWGMPFSTTSLMYWLNWGACQPSVFVRRSALQAVGGIDRARNLSVDTDLFLRLAKQSRPQKIDHFLGALRLHADSQSTLDAAGVKAADQEIRAQHGMPRLPWVARRGIFLAYKFRYHAFQLSRELVRRRGQYPVGTFVPESGARRQSGESSHQAFP